MKKSLYAILGVPPNAELDALRSAYERLNAQAPEDDAVQRLALKEAWSVLGNPQRRAAYDALLHTQAQRAAGAGAGAGRLGASSAAEDDAARSKTPLWVGMILVVLIGAGLASRSPKPAEPSAQERARQRSSEPVVLSAPQALVAPAVMQTSIPQNTRTAEAAQGLSPEQLFERASASVVRVVALNAYGEPMSQGSGVVVDRNTVVTNCHVTRKAARIKVKHKGELHEASMHTADEAHDLCKLSLAGLPAPSVALGRVGSLRVGQKVYAIGSPQGLDLTLSDGMVSSLREGPEGTLVQTTAPISPGSSGGGLFNEQGELVGIVTFQMRSGQNLNFAIPVDWIGTMSSTQGPMR